MTSAQKTIKSKRQLILAIIASGIGLAGGAAWRVYSQTSHSTSVNPSHPAFSDPAWQQLISTPDQKTIQLKDFAGQKLVINFWATWCPPCIEELPLLEKFYQEQKQNNWMVVGLAIDKLASVQQFLKQNSLSFPIGVGNFELMTISKNWGNLSGSLPFTMVIDSNGVVVQRRIGTVKESDLQAWKTII
jgi:peroxiredoxin